MTTIHVPFFYHPPGRHLDKSGKLLHSLHLQVILPSFPWYPIHRLPPCRGGTMVRPMITIIFACVCWLTVPTLFAPYPTWQNLCEVRGVMRGWIMYFKGFEGTVIDKLVVLWVLTSDDDLQFAIQYEVYIYIQYYSIYDTGMTVSEFVALGGRWGLLSLHDEMPSRSEQSRALQQ